MNKIIILGSGAAPGVPSLSKGWGKCNPDNPKNNRLRVGTYIEYNGTKFLIDTSPDIRQQLITHQIKGVDAVLYTHNHADHLHGIDYLREINRITKKGINIYGDKTIIKAIKKGFDYLLVSKDKELKYIKPSLIPNIIKPNHPFYIKNVKITPLKLLGHPGGSIGYSFDDGKIVFISDFKALANSALKAVSSKNPEIMFMPLTTDYDHPYHADLKQILHYKEIINPRMLIINHMSTDCDYDIINSGTPDDVIIAYDNMIIEGF